MTVTLTTADPERGRVNVVIMDANEQIVAAKVVDNMAVDDFLPLLERSAYKIHDLRQL